MTFLKKFLHQFLSSDNRQSARHAFTGVTQCAVKAPRYHETVQVYLGDVSSTGFSFFYKRPWFEVGDTIEVLFSKNVKSTSVAGEIVSQRIFYPEGTEDIKHAIYRYSARFATPLEDEWIEILKDNSVSD